jgi:hypothetical protein
MSKDEVLKREAEVNEQFRPIELTSETVADRASLPTELLRRPFPSRDVRRSSSACRRIRASEPDDYPTSSVGSIDFSILTNGTAAPPRSSST